MTQVPSVVRRYFPCIRASGTHWSDQQHQLSSRSSSSHHTGGQGWRGLRQSVLSLPMISVQLNLIGGASGKEPTCQCRRQKRRQFNPWVRKTPRSRKGQHPPVLLPGESHGQRILVGSRPWGRRELGMTEVPLHARSLVESGGLRVDWKKSSLTFLSNEDSSCVKTLNHWS